ncbi:3-deoxy-7-phosphoheptulonate synthase [uncultured Anaerovibrio sp.]|uniref:3-deoxy-7-phosphoheptulonate synthase n=1 Tax=uncultured Anaerovibrio sp. TaxID=361586 RepID=UPI00261FC9EA|nr:3-deoxy-7-phosphoheptulonate synthase [uncultured Anaerovibrio sp.]
MSMEMEFIRVLPSPQSLMEDYPISNKAKKIKLERDKTIKDIFAGKDQRLAMIIGPCSSDNEDAVLDYVSRLARVQEKIKDKIFIVPRLYTNKPRTIGVGYKGMLHQPSPKGEEDMLEGIIAIRKLNVRVVEETGLTGAEEILYPEVFRYLSDLLCYAAVGARSSEDQLHRMIASGVGIPVGLKNPTSGDLSVMLNSVAAAQHSQEFLFRGWEVRTKGNAFAHSILRGYVDATGQSLPNYHYETLTKVIDMYEGRGLENPAIIIDTNHANSGKHCLEQVRIAKDIINSRILNPAIKTIVKGLMVESYIEDGCQKIDGGVYGKSITDPCLGWEKTERLLYDLADML